MTDVVVTVPKWQWEFWLTEGDLAGEPWSETTEYHFWFGGPIPDIQPGERVYIVAHGKLRGYAPLVRIEKSCKLWPDRHCFVRRGDAVAVTIPYPIRGFQGWVVPWWPRAAEIPFPDWRQANG